MLVRRGPGHDRLVPRPPSAASPATAARSVRHPDGTVDAIARVASFPTWAVALVAFLCLAGAACSSSASETGNDNVLVVNGVALSNRDFRSRLDAIAASPDYVAQLTSPDSQPVKVEGTAKGTYSHEFIAQALSQQVQFVVAGQEVAKRGLKVTDDDRAAAQATLAQGFSSSGTGDNPGPAQNPPGTAVDASSGQKALDDLGAFKPVLIEGVADLQAVRKDIAAQLSSDAGLRKVFDQSGDTYKNQACTNVLLVKTSSSADPSSPTTAPPSPADDAAACSPRSPACRPSCRPAPTSLPSPPSPTTRWSKRRTATWGASPSVPGTMSQSWRTPSRSQPVGAIGPPIKTSFGYWIVQVRVRGDLTFEQARDELVNNTSTAADDAYSAWYQEAFSTVDVTVDPQWGVWNKGNGTFDPPNGSPDTTRPITTTTTR